VHLNWIWGPLHASSIAPLLATGFKNVSHAMCTNLAERLDEETNNFHMPIVEMIITLNDVSCLSHISIHRKMMTHMDKIFQDQGAELMVEVLGVDEDYAVEECKKMFCGYIAFAWLK
jgi:hypothetical protein